MRPPIAIRARSRQCFRGGEVFTQGMEYVSVLDDDFLRRDYCIGCWEQVEVSPLVHWRSRVREREKTSFAASRKNEKGLELLRELVQTFQSELISEAFVLALYLARTKVLQWKQDEGDILVLEVVATEEIICVKKIDLSSIQTDIVRRSLAQKLRKPAVGVL